MKKTVSLFLVLILLLTFVGCGKKAPESVRGTIVVDGVSYTNPEQPVKELPKGFEYVDMLSEEQAGETSLFGCAYFADPAKDGVLYVYEDIITATGEDTGEDPGLAEWVYVKWIAE